MRRKCLSQLATSTPAILPSLLLCDFGHLADEITRLQDAGVHTLHLDVMDGVFVPNFTYGMTIVQAIRSLTNMTVDVHLMMVSPEKYIPQFFDAGADIITIHAEAVDDPRPVLDQIKDLGAGAGIAVNPPTPVSAIANCLPHADMALVMSVNAGFGGQSFDPTVLTKLTEIRALPGGEKILLEMDGGINPDTIQQCTDAGAQLLVAGSAVFKQANYRDAIESMLGRVNA
jgi:ribulose-phosphate 3-epimerase